MHNFKVRFIKVRLCMIAVHDIVQPSDPNEIRVVLANNTLPLHIEICFTYATIAI